MAAKDEHLALSSGIGPGGLAVSNFWDYSSEAFSFKTLKTNWTKFIKM